jgi:hypothetical protein
MVFIRPGKGSNDGAGKRPERGGGRERPPSRYDEHDPDDPRTPEYDEIDEVLKYLRSIEFNRGQWQYATAALQRMIDSSLELTETWNQFQAAGGVTADDFSDFINGKWRVRRTSSRRHLRLLVSNPRRPVRLRVHRGGDDAA